MTDQIPEILVRAAIGSTTVRVAPSRGADRINLDMATEYGCALGALSQPELVDLANRILATYGPK